MGNELEPRDASRKNSLIFSLVFAIAKKENAHFPQSRPDWKPTGMSDIL